MRPFHQGKVDTFCAIYAVLNALQLLYEIRPLTGRELFNEVILDLARGDEEYFRAVLNLKTDYRELVDRMLAGVASRFPLRVERPFPPGTGRKTVWQALTEYADPERKRTAVFRFCRYVPDRPAPLADHWTTSLRMDGEGLHLFDCSLEPEGVYCLPPGMVAVRPGFVNREYFLVPPECVRLLSLPQPV
jgi:hypothetical protein